MTVCANCLILPRWGAAVLRPYLESGEAAAYCWGDDAQLGHELIELAGLEGLRAVGKSVIGIVADFAESAEKMIILHVARADLKNIHIAEHHLDLRRVHDFADGEELEFLGGLAHKLEALLTHALEGVGRSAGFEGAGAENFGACF